MSPRTTAASRRRLSRTPAYARRERREVLEAVVAVVSILVGTGVAIWAMRPGGIAARQPRAVVLGIILAVVLAVALRLLVGTDRRFSDRPLLGWAAALGMTAAVGVVAALAWPGGVVVEGDSPPTLVPDPIDAPPIDTDGLPPGFEEQLDGGDSPIPGGEADPPPADEPPPAP